MAKVKAELDSCKDCVLTIANSEGPDGHAAKMHKHYGDGVRHLVVSGDDYWFSARECDTCGNTLAGDRMHVAELAPDNGMMYADHPAKVVRVTATVEFEAYVFDYPDDVILTERPDGMSPTGESLAERIGYEIADAVWYRASHGVDSEPGDALIAMRDHVDVSGVVVTDTDLSGDVEAAAEGTSGEL